MGATSVLARRDLVVARLHRDADLVELGLQLVHEGEHAIGDRAEVLVLHLLALRGLGAEERPARVDQIRAREVEVPVDQEVLLLGPAGRDDAIGVRPEELQDADGLLRQRLDRAQERRLLVERLTRPAHERGRDDERRPVLPDQQPGRARRIPGGVAARLERGPHPAGREARGIGLALDQLLPAELRHGPPIGVGRDERVVLLRRDTRQRLEPVGVVRRTGLDRPVLHRGGDDVGGRRVERLAVRHRAAQRLEHVPRQPPPLHVVVEGERAEDLGRLGRPRRGGLPVLDAPLDDAVGRVLES